MLTSSSRWLMCFAVAAVAIGPSTALAGGDHKSEQTVRVVSDRTYWGFGAQVRRSYVSVGIQHLFVDDTPGAAQQDGAGLELTRRVKTIEVGLDLGYDPFHGKNGFYLDKNKDPTATNTVDYVEFDKDLSWFTIAIDATARLQIHKILSLRFGAGLGVGVIHGNIYRTSQICTSAHIQRDCVRDPTGPRQHERVDLPPVLPVLDVLAGVEFRPFQFIAFHVDVGLHTVPYVSAGATVYMW